MAEKIFITGLGIISAIGGNTDETLRSLLLSQTGIGSISILKTNHKNIPVAEVKYNNDVLRKMAGLDNNTEIFTRTSLLGLIAIREAIKGRSFSKTELKRTGLISATTVGGMPASENHYRNLLVSSDGKEYVETFDSGDSTEKFADYLGVDRYITTINTACSSSANAIMLGARLIWMGLVDRVIVGGTDSLTRFTLNGFNALEILNKQPCSPFDKNRDGLTIGEGAAFLLLESEKSVIKKNIICEFKGYGNCNDAFHATASSPDGIGAFLAMQKALSRSGLMVKDIDYINAHGTGTDINDLSEGRAIERLFMNNIPLVSSTKAFTGHTLGAAGAIEAIVASLCLKHDFVPANLNFCLKMDELSFEPVRTIVKDKLIRNVLSNSFGFGGNSSSLIFSKY